MSIPTHGIISEHAKALVLYTIDVVLKGIAELKHLFQPELMIGVLN